MCRTALHRPRRLHDHSRSDSGALDRRCRRPRRRWHLSALLLVVLLTGCAEEASDDRRFANEAAPAEDRPTATTIATAEGEVAEPTIAEPSPETLLAARGAPEVVYAAVGGQLWAVSDEQPRQLPLPEGDTPLALDGSPSGDAVAVAVTDAGGKVSLLLLDAQGVLLRRVEGVLPGRGSAPATPDPDPPAAPTVFLDWGLQGDVVLMGTTAGDLVAVPVDGAPRPIPLSLGGEALLEAKLSPRGDSFALLSRDGAGIATLRVASLDASQSSAARTVAPRERTDERTVRSMAWLPDGGSLLYVEGAAGGNDVAAEGELFQVQLAGLERELVATGGVAGPIGSITDFQVSPDGKSVAYVVGVQEEARPFVHSVWLVSLRGATEFQVPIGDVTEIAGIWWTPNGLIWAEPAGMPTGGSEVRFQGIGTDATQSTLFTIDVGAVGASPVSASPVASPVMAPQVGATPAG